MQPMDHCLNEETADPTQADPTQTAPKLAHGTVFSAPYRAQAAAPTLASHRSAARVQPMYHCLIEKAADSTQAASKLAHGTACSPAQQVLLQFQFRIDLQHQCSQRIPVS